MAVTCVDCGKRIDNGPRCEADRLEAQRLRSRRRGRRHYTGDYERRSAEVRATTTRCWFADNIAGWALCDGSPRSQDPWEAHHVVPADPKSDLRGAHRSCNAAWGNKRPPVD